MVGRDSVEPIFRGGRRIACRSRHGCLYNTFVKAMRSLKARRSGKQTSPQERVKMKRSRLAIRLAKESAAEMSGLALVWAAAG